MNRFLWAIISLLLVLPGVAAATKLYKWVDKNGKVTYQETPPPSGAGKVEEKNIDPDQNVIKADHPPPQSTSDPRPNIGVSRQPVPHAGGSSPPVGALLDGELGAEIPPPAPPPAGIR